MNGQPVRVGLIFLAQFDDRSVALLQRCRRALERLARGGWRLSIDGMVGRQDRGAVVYRASTFHDIDLFGVFEAPDWAAALEGMALLEAAGWGRLFRCSWLLGPRDLGPTPTPAPPAGGLGFLALWNWNEAWHAASLAERSAYDVDCDIAFGNDTALGADQAGRFSTSLTSAWDHVSLWEITDAAMLGRAMRVHEEVRDFMFTASSHYIGWAMPFADLEDER